MIQIINQFKQFFNPSPAPFLDNFEQIIEQTYEEIKARNKFYCDIKVNELETYQKEVSTWPDKQKVQFIVYCAQEMNTYRSSQSRTREANIPYQLNLIRNNYLNHLFRTKIIFEESDIKAIQVAFCTYQKDYWSVLYEWPLKRFLNSIQKQYSKTSYTPIIIEAIHAIKDLVHKIPSDFYDKEKLALQDQIEQMLHEASDEAERERPFLFQGVDRFREEGNQLIQQIPSTQKDHFYQLLKLASKAKAGKPTKKFLQQSKALLAEIEVKTFKTFVVNCLELLQLK